MNMTLNRSRERTIETVDGVHPIPDDCLLDSQELVEYSADYNGKPYKVATESMINARHLSYVRILLKRYPNLRNVWYGWDCCPTCEKPPFPVKNSIKILNDIWKNVRLLNKGTYMIAADTQRILDIYHRRWLTEKNHFKLLESGIIDGTPYIIVDKTLYESGEK